MNGQYLDELPEDYECVDITEQFDFNHAKWRKATKKQRRKFKGLYGITYLGETQVTTGLLRAIAIHVFNKRHGFIVVSEDELHNSLEYVKV